MKRLATLLIVVLALGLGLISLVGTVGCEDQASSNAAADLGVQEGQRPKDKDKRPPPGPRDGGFEQGEEGQQVPGQQPTGGGDGN